MSPYGPDHENFCQRCYFDSVLETLTQSEIAALTHRSILVQGWKDHLDIRCSDVDKRTLLALLFHVNSLKAQYNVNLLQIQEANGLHRIQSHQVIIFLHFFLCSFLAIPLSLYGSPNPVVLSLYFSLSATRLFAHKRKYTNIPPLSRPFHLKTFKRRLYTHPTLTQPLLPRTLSIQLTPTSLPIDLLLSFSIS